MDLIPGPQGGEQLYINLSRPITSRLGLLLISQLVLSKHAEIPINLSYDNPKPCITICFLVSSFGKGKRHC